MFTLGSRASLENTDRFTSGRTYSSSPQDCRDQALGGGGGGGGGGGRKTKMAAHYSRESITTILGGNGGLHVIGPDRPVLSSVHYK